VVQCVGCTDLQRVFRLDPLQLTRGTPFCFSVTVCVSRSLGLQQQEAQPSDSCGQHLLAAQVVDQGPCDRAPQVCCGCADCLRAQ
jgi:hypothetical protein